MTRNGLTRLIFVLLAIQYNFANKTTLDEKANEFLIISKLRNEDILTRFQFSIEGTSKADGVELQYISWLPRQLFLEYDILHLEISFTQGFWRDVIWGNHQNVSTPSGTQLRVRFGDNHNESINTRWSHLIHQLNGIFCTSILEMKTVFTSTPHLFSRELNVNVISEETKWRYGVLPSETMCSENLKAWKKFLPCKQHGLVSLLEPRNSLSSNFYSLALTIQRNIQKKRTVWSLDARSNMVFDGKQHGKKYWSFKSLFGKNLLSKCTISNANKIFVKKITDWKLDPLADSEVKLGNEFYHAYDLKKWNASQAFQLSAKTSKVSSRKVPSPVISVENYFTSTDTTMGVLTTEITNPTARKLLASFTHMIPWQIRVYLHTLNLRCENISSSGYWRAVSKENRFQLAKDLDKPLLLEMLIEIPEQSICKISADYESSFLKITSFPADANSGVYVPGSMVTFFSHDATLSSHVHEEEITLHGEPLLILLPVPDFSMPFNVIVIVCSLIAMFYGNVFTITTKIMKPVVQKNDEGKKNILNIWQHLRERCTRLCRIF